MHNINKFKLSLKKLNWKLLLLIIINVFYENQILKFTIKHIVIRLKTR